MVSAYKRGLKRVFVYYLLGVIATLIFHIVTGWESKVMMPKSTMLLILVIMIGLPWAILNVMGLGCPVKRSQNSGELTVHSVVFIIAIAFVFYTRSFI
jgi:hypothetical protein